MSDRPRVGIGVFVWRDGKFLMGRRRGSHGHDTWSVPGGHLEFSESWEACAKREVKEETGMDITNIQFFAATNDYFKDDSKHYITIWVKSDWQKNEPSLTEPDKWVDHKWVDFKNLPEPLFEPCFTNLKKAKPELFS